ncbi:MAG: hypothetical protein ACREQH_07475 [Candidatus Binatus sp.]
MAEEKRVAGVPTGVIAFLPWIVFGVASGFNHWRVATSGGLILCLVYLAVLIRRRVSIKLMDWTVLTFFAIASVLTVGLGSTTFPTYNAVVVWTCFASAAWGSVLIRRSFTAVYARESAPPEFWHHPIFLRLNLIMTLVWCGLTTVNIGIAMTGVVIGGLFGRVALGFGLPMALLMSGFIFNRRFPSRFLARAGFQVPATSAPAA